MANRVFAYNPSHTPIEGTIQVGDLAIGTTIRDYSTRPGGVIFWGGPLENLGYVIAGPVPSMDRSTPIGNIGTVRFWRSKALTDESFLELVNKLTNGIITDAESASQWLIDNGYWSSWKYTLISFIDNYIIVKKTDNSVWSWIDNSQGQIGDNTTTNRATPVSILGNKKTFCQISGSFYHRSGIEHNGQVWSWGFNNWGQIGDNTQTNKCTPVSILGTKKTFCKISAGYNHTLGIDKYGQVWSWGYNNNGGLGINLSGIGSLYRCTPVSILGNKKTFCQISGGGEYSIAIDKNGQIWSWGINTSGQLGDNTITNKCTPVSIHGNKKTFTQISKSLALEHNGQVWGWGINTSGQLGDNTTISRRTPVSILGNKKTFCKIVSSDNCYKAIDNRGMIWSWGINSEGELGDNTITNKCTPVSIHGAKKTFCQIATGPREIGLDSNGNVWSWGGYVYGGSKTPVRVYGL